MSHHQILLEKIRQRTATVGILGLGYVGLPLAIRFARAGFPVLGLDIDQTKAEMLEAGTLYLKHMPADAIKVLRDSKFEATSNFSRLAEVDIFVICVPTPLNEHREPDLSYVVSTIESIVPHLRPGHAICLESTTYPGTTEEEVASRVYLTGQIVGEEVFVIYSPEREDPGNPIDPRNVPKVVSGMTKNCLDIATAFYQTIVDMTVPVSSTQAAELTKLLENIHRAVNIGLVNEMKIVADRMDLDIHEIIAAASTKPFGFVPYFPGPGLGGHCIPIDPFYLTWKARAHGVTTRFIELAGEINSSMPSWVAEKVGKALNDKVKAVKGSRILILGIAYKKNIDDTRESPAAEIMKILNQQGADVSYSDPHVPIFPRMRKYDFQLESIPIDPDMLSSYDVVVLVTDHDAFDYERIGRYATTIVDTRGRFGKCSATIVKA